MALKAEPGEVLPGALEAQGSCCSSLYLTLLQVPLLGGVMALSVFTLGEEEALIGPDGTSPNFRTYLLSEPQLR